MTKAKVLVSTIGMEEKEWLTWRQKGIGGSDASVICGLNKYKSPVELWMEKTGQIEPKVAGEAAYWGNVLEPIVRAEFVNRTNLQIKRENSILQHPEYPFMLANLDGIVADPVRGSCVFEAKTTNAYKSDEWVENVPEDYQLQLAHYLSVTGFPGAYIAVLIGGNQFRWKFIPRDDDLIAILIELESIFWSHVVNMTPPPMDGSDASTGLLNRMYPFSRSKSQLILPAETTLPLIAQYEEFALQEKDAANRKDEAANKLKDLIGDNETAFAGERIITWKSISSERLDTKLLKAEQTEIYAKYVNTSSYRRFSIK